MGTDRTLLTGFYTLECGQSIHMPYKCGNKKLSTVAILCGGISVKDRINDYYEQ